MVRKVILPILVLFIAAAGCAAFDPIVGNWKCTTTGAEIMEINCYWDQSFAADAIHGGFSGTWENTGDNNYLLTYYDTSGRQNTFYLVVDPGNEAAYLKANPGVRFRKG